MNPVCINNSFRIKSVQSSGRRREHLLAQSRIHDHRGFNRDLGRVLLDLRHGREN